MSIQNSPYAAFATLLASSPQTVSPAELHGLLLGRSCAGAGFDVEPWLTDASDLLGEAPSFHEQHQGSHAAVRALSPFTRGFVSLPATGLERGRG